MTTLNTTLDKFFNKHYKEIVHIARKICKTSSRHVYEDLAHHAMEAFVKHPRAEELIEKKQAKLFFSGIIYRSWHYKTSPYHKERSGYKKEEELYPDVVGDGGLDMWLNPGHYYNLWSNIDEDFKHYEEQLESMIDGTLVDHDNLEAIRGIMEDMEADTVEQWFRVKLFQMWLEQPNYSKLSRITGIPRTSISQAVNECKAYIKETIELWR